MKKNAKKLNKIKEETLYELELIKEEYENLLEKTRKKSKLEKALNYLNNEDLEQLYIKRKDKKYAALTVELYALLEQLLKKLHELFKKEEFKFNSKENKNIILCLEEKLKDDLKFKNNTKELADLRKYIIHTEFSLKKARKSIGNNNLKNKEQFNTLLKNTKEYINIIKIN